MKILLCHNYYQQRGGEDAVFEAEAALLESRGHSVERFTAHNADIAPAQKIRVGLRAAWNPGVHRQVSEIIRRCKPDIMHCHNTFPLISPAIYYAAAAEQVPVVQTLHNFRPVCLNGMLYRDGHLCEDCLGRTLPGPGLRHGCYRNSRLQSLAPALSQALHNLRSTWQKKVSLFLVFSGGAMYEKYQRAGFPTEKLFIKPNFLAPDPGAGKGDGGFALYVGRLEQAKGVGDMLEAWSVPGKRLPLKIVGDGPLLQKAATFAATRSDIDVLGRKPLTETMALMQKAAFLVFPSRLLEGMPRTIIESFACGTPVLAAREGAARDMIRAGETGAFFGVADPGDLARQAEHLSGRTSYTNGMRESARKEFEREYTADKGYDLLMQAYDLAGGNGGVDEAVSR